MKRDVIILFTTSQIPANIYAVLVTDMHSEYSLLSFLQVTFL